MDDPDIRVVHSSEGDCVVHAVIASCGKRMLRRNRYCMVEETSVPQVELEHSMERERALYTLAGVWFEYLLVDSSCNISRPIGETRDYNCLFFFCWRACIGPLGVAEVALVRWTTYGVAAAAALSSTASVDAFPG